MKIIVGLGNIGAQYDNTYHNVGFWALDALADKLNVTFGSSKCDASIALADYNGTRILLAKPTTFMNRSGTAVQKLLKYYKCDVGDLVVLYDDIDIPKGKLRYRESGSSGTHNGMRDIVYYIGENFKRVRIGAGRPPEGWNLANYVLSNVKAEDKVLLDGAVIGAVDRVLELCR